MNYYLNLEYPYYNLWYKFDKNNILNIIDKFKPIIYNIVPNNLKNKNIKKFNDTYFLIKDDYNKTSLINNITDYFSEKMRIKCNFKGHISTLDYWKKNKQNIINNLLKRKKNINIYNIRENIFFNHKLCNNFRITVCLAILNYFKPKKWLDISAGWGDRLLSAIFYKISKYVSCDPNLDLHESYEKIINTFLPETKKKNFIIHKNGFLEAPIKDKFDIVFSSPPFFDLEIYSNYNENSLKKIKTEDDWINKFFIPSLIKSYNYLKKNGYMILYMGGSKKVMDCMHKLDDIMDYKGIIYYYDVNRNPRAIYVWKKINSKKIKKIYY